MGFSIQIGKVCLVNFGSIKAFITVNIGPVEIRGFKIIEYGGRVRVQAPGCAVTCDGMTEHYEYVRFSDKDSREAFVRLVLSKYEEEKALSQKRG